MIDEFREWWQGIRDKFGLPNVGEPPKSARMIWDAGRAAMADALAAAEAKIAQLEKRPDVGEWTTLEGAWVIAEEKVKRLTKRIETLSENLSSAWTLSGNLKWVRWSEDGVRDARATNELSKRLRVFVAEYGHLWDDVDVETCEIAADALDAAESGLQYGWLANEKLQAEIEQLRTHAS